MFGRYFIPLAIFSYSRGSLFIPFIRVLPLFGWPIHARVAGATNKREQDHRGQGAGGGVWAQLTNQFWVKSTRGDWAISFFLFKVNQALIVLTLPWCAHHGWPGLGAAQLHGKLSWIVGNVPRPRVLIYFMHLLYTAHSSHSESLLQEMSSSHTHCRLQVQVVANFERLSM